MTVPLRSCLSVLVCCAAAGSAALAREYRVTVPAADVPRAGLVVQLELPAGVTEAWLRDAQGRVLPVQPGREGAPARFVVAEQAAGQPLAFTLSEERPAGAADWPEARRSEDVAPLQLGFGEREPAPLAYWAKERPLPRGGIDPLYLRGGFIHPVLTPAGVRVTDSYAEDHLHHHGIWSPWTKTRFQGREPDFWNMGQGRGKVEVEQLDQVWLGRVHAGLAARHRFVDLTSGQPVTALHETWEVTVYAPHPHAARTAHVFDLVLTQTCATDDPLILPEYHYGGLGYRGHEQWNGADQAFFLTSEGLTDRVAAHATRARWCHVGGRVNGQLAGTAILGHPENFRAPQPMRIHPTEPFFCYAPSQLGEWQIRPGEPYVARYRFVVMDGAPDAALLDAYWNAFAHPATARVEPL